MMPRRKREKTMADNAERPASPWDFFDPQIGRVAEEVAHARLDICKVCEQYVSLLHLCSECGCVMNAKVKLPNAFCPLRKWNTAPSEQPHDPRVVING
jgi:hypothetical protein